MDHPIKEFMDQLFPSKPEQKRIMWAQFLINEEYDTVEDLAKISPQVWNKFEGKLPTSIVESIKQKFKVDSVSSSKQEPKVQTPKNAQETMKNEKTELKLNAEQVANNQKKREQKYNPSDSRTIDERQIIGKDLTKMSLGQNENFQNNISLKIQPKIKKEEMEKASLDEDDITTIIQLINSNFKIEKILKMMNAPKDSKYEQLILQRINTLLRPPMPPPAARQIPLRFTDELTLPCYHYIGKEDYTRKYYTFLVVGETGSGKTTLLDAFVNCLRGVSFYDNWRWKLVDESHLNQVKDGQSKTTIITPYFINDVENRFNIKIIDTPGFGDTKGIKVDDEIAQKFQQLFKNLPEIDYILITIKASETRLKPGSKYIYDRVQQLFGNDAKDRFLMMCTFADGKKPKCVSAVGPSGQNIYYSEYFTFNNSVLYTPSDQGNKDLNKNTNFFWKMGFESIKNFSKFIVQAGRNPISLTLSKAVLQTRKYLQTSISSSQQYFQLALRQLDEGRQSFANLQKNKHQIQANGKYTDIIIEKKLQKQPLGKVVQMCSICQVTCCQVCEWPPNFVQSRCTYFTRNDPRCPICPGKCYKSPHVRADYLIVWQQHKKQIILDLNKKYHDQGISKGTMFLRELLQKKSKLLNNINRVKTLNKQVQDGLLQLQKTALKPKLFTDKDYYLQMLQSEETNQKQGWSERVKHLKVVVNKLQTLETMQKTKNVEDLLPGLKQFEKQVKEAEAGSKSNPNCEIY